MLQRTLQILRKYEIDVGIVHNHGWTTHVLARGIANHCNVPLVTTLHFLERQYLQACDVPTAPDLPNILAIERSMFNESDALIVPSSQMHDTLVELYSEYLTENQSITILPHGIAPEWFRCSRNSSKKTSKNCHILFAGRLVSEKGIYSLLLVANQILEIRPHVRFIIAGAGYLLDELKAHFSDPRIRFLGSISTADLQTLMMQVDIFCLPTLTESFGMAVLEAMAAGLPVVTTRGKGVAELIEDQQTGLTVPLTFEGNRAKVDQQELLCSLCTLIDDPSLRHKLGRQARRVVEQDYSLDSITSRLACLYDETIDRSSITSTNSSKALNAKFLYQEKLDFSQNLNVLGPPSSVYGRRLPNMNYEHLQSFVVHYRDISDVLGILLVGSGSRYYCDALSDYDFEVIVRDDYYENLPQKERFIICHQETINTEYLIIPKKDFLAKEYSSADIDHWPYEECVVLHDPIGFLESKLPLIVAMSADLRYDRLKLHYFEFLFAAKRMSRMLQRGDELNARLVAYQSALFAIKLVFILRYRWPPVIHWTSQNLMQLEGIPGHLKALLVEILRQPNGSATDSLILEIDGLLAKEKFPYTLSKNALAGEVAGFEFRHLREKYGNI
jgi:glycosyltransferase involved in cell wall biosynthesis